MSDLGTKLYQMFPALPRRPSPLRDDGEGAYIAFWPLPGDPPTIEAIERWQPAAERRKVSKDLVEQRLAAVGKLDACMAIIMGNAAFFTRWYARAFPWVYADDTDTIAVIKAVEANPESILGPE